MSRHIVFIHGLFMNPDSWQGWKLFFEKEGYTCHTPAYPFHAGNPLEIKKKFEPALGHLTFSRVEEELIHFIDSLPEKPIVIGHSMGGLLAQKLVQKNKCGAAVLIDSAPPKGVVSLKLSFLRANFPVINPFKGNSVFEPSIKWFHYAFCNTMSLHETKEIFERYVVPESRNIARDSTGAAGKIDFKKPHAPMLFIAGEKDNIIPAGLNKKNFEAYTDENSRREFKLFKDRSHYICGQQGWETVASYVNGWISQLPDR